MKQYNTTYTKPNGKTESGTFFRATDAKRWMKERPGSTGTITKIYSNGDWEPCGEITLNGSNAVRMSTERVANYR